MQSPWAVVDLGSILDKQPGAATQACPVKVSPRLAGPRVVLWYCVKVHTGGRGGGGPGGGGLWTIIRRKGRPVTPLTQQRWSEPWMAISWCFSINTRLLATPRNAGTLSCHRAVVFPPSPGFSTHGSTLRGRRQSVLCQLEACPEKTLNGLLNLTAWPKRKRGLKLTGGQIKLHIKPLSVHDMTCYTLTLESDPGRSTITAASSPARVHRGICLPACQHASCA